MSIAEIFRIRSSSLYQGGIICVNGCALEVDTLTINFQNIIENNVYIGTAVSFDGTVITDPLGNTLTNALRPDDQQEHEHSLLFENILLQLFKQSPYNTGTYVRLRTGLRNIKSRITRKQTFFGIDSWYSFWTSGDSGIDKARENQTKSPTVSLDTHPNGPFLTSFGLGSSVVLVPSYLLWTPENAFGNAPLVGNPSSTVKRLIDLGLCARWPFLVSDVQLRWGFVGEGPKSTFVVSGSYVVNPLLSDFDTNKIRNNIAYFNISTRVIDDGTNQRMTSIMIYVRFLSPHLPPPSPSLFVPYMPSSCKVVSYNVAIAKDNTGMGIELVVVNDHLVFSQRVTSVCRYIKVTETASFVSPLQNFRLGAESLEASASQMRAAHAQESVNLDLQTAQAAAATVAIAAGSLAGGLAAAGGRAAKASAAMRNFAPNAGGPAMDMISSAINADLANQRQSAQRRQMSVEIESQIFPYINRRLSVDVIGWPVTLSLAIQAAANDVVLERFQTWCLLSHPYIRGGKYASLEHMSAGKALISAITTPKLGTSDRLSYMYWKSWWYSQKYDNFSLDKLETLCNQIITIHNVGLQIMATAEKKYYLLKGFGLYGDIGATFALYALMSPYGISSINNTVSYDHNNNRYSVDFSVSFACSMSTYLSSIIFLHSLSLFTFRMTTTSLEFEYDIWTKTKLLHPDYVTPSILDLGFISTFKVGARRSRQLYLTSHNKLGIEYGFVSMNNSTHHMDFHNAAMNNTHMLVGITAFSSGLPPVNTYDEHLIGSYPSLFVVTSKVNYGKLPENWSSYPGFVPLTFYGPNFSGNYNTVTLIPPIEKNVMQVTSYHEHPISVWQQNNIKILERGTFDVVKRFPILSPSHTVYVQTVVPRSPNEMPKYVYHEYGAEWNQDENIHPMSNHPFKVLLSRSVVTSKNFVGSDSLGFHSDLSKTSICLWVASPTSYLEDVTLPYFDVIPIAD